MGSATKLKACYACTNGKRKCDKAQPICGRCSDRDVECRYPPTKRKRVHTSSAPGAENGGESAGRLSVGPPSLMRIPFSTPNDGMIDLNQWAASLSNWDALPAAELPNDSPATSSETISRLSSQKDPVDFFLRPEAWAIRHIPFTTPSFPNSVCMNYIHGIHEFFTEWVTNSHSPFIHNQLYADAGLPPSIQDAFTCIILHNSKTPANETVIDELLASKTSALLKAYCPDLVGPEVSLGIREHLSRTQALFVHLVLALFSPSISARANAEQQIQTLLSWTRQLWEAALRDPDIGLPCDGGDSSAAAASANGIILDSIFDGDPLPRKWRSWVLSESIRRIWLLATSTIGVYFTLKQKWAECHGGIYFTAHKDLWEAKTGFAWAAACRKADPLFICSLDCEGLFLSAKASDVDPMLVNMFTIMWGVERVENWVARTCEPGDEVKVWRGTDLPMEKGRIAPS